jgi:hypothetical protein
MAKATIDLSKRIQVPRILWGALLSATVVFLVIIVFQKQGGHVPVTPQNAVMLPVFAAVAVIVSTISLLMPRQLHMQALKAAKFEVTSEADPEAVGMFRDAAPGIRVFANPTAVAKRAVVLYHTPLILGLALSEAVSLFGFILGMLGFELLHILPFWLMSWALIAIRFPTEKSVIGPAEKAYDAVLR